jgi:hypothetical protein
MIILIIIFFIIVLLYIGIKIAFIYDKKGSNLKGCLKILILKKIKVYSIDFPSNEKDEKGEKEEKKDEKTSKDIKKILELARPCLDDIKLFLKSFMKCINVHTLKNHLIFGLDSYADTAKYIGYIWGMLIVVNNSHKNARFSAEPSFNGSVLDAHGINEIEINLLKVIPPALKLISKKEVRDLIRGVRNG